MAQVYKSRGQEPEAVMRVVTRLDFTPLINHPDVAAEFFFIFYVVS